MNGYKYLLFDADNTIFDFNRSEHDALALTFASFGIELTEDQHEVYHVINDALWKQLEKGEVSRESLKILRFARFIEYLAVGDLDCKAIAATYVEMLSRQSYLIDGAFDVCEKLARSYPLYLITNGITTVQKRRFDASPIKKLFSDIFISEEMGVAKPSAEYFRKVSKAVGDDDVRRYLVIGDSLSSDIKGAVNFGCDSIWITPEGSESPLPTYTVNSLSGIFEILNQRSRDEI